MHVTVAICTWNRSELLDQTLTTMRRLSIPNGVEWNIVVVNNNSTDNTQAVIARHSTHLPVVEVHEPRQGISHARNRAATAARGDLVLWTDDDVLVDTQWLSEYVKAAADWPEVSFFGGTVEPWFAAEPPTWLRRHLNSVAGAYALREPGVEPRPIAATEFPVTANLAIRSRLLRDFCFDPRIGQVGNELLKGEDTDFIVRIRAAGHVGIWVGAARVQHYLPAERLCKHYLWDLFRAGGRSHARTVGVPDCPYFGDAPRWAVSRYWRARFLAAVTAPFKGRRWLDAFRETAQLGGFIDECRVMRRNARQSQNG